GAIVDRDHRPHHHRLDRGGRRHSIRRGRDPTRSGADLPPPGRRRHLPRERESGEICRLRPAGTMTIATSVTSPLRRRSPRPDLAAPATGAMSDDGCRLRSP
ncbi:hypothetical protein EE612_038058, partial [Oryza sativa]